MSGVVGEFNVVLYSEVNVAGDGKEYHLIDLSKWDKEKLEAQNFLYVEHSNYQIANEVLENREVLEKLISLPRHTKLHFERKIEIVIEKGESHV